MNIKKLLILGLILIAVSSTIAAISAEDVVTTTSQTKLLEGNKLTLNGIQFTIPEGFSELESESDVSGLDDDGEKDIEDIDGTAVDSALSSDFKNAAGDKLDIEVGIKGNDQKIDSINPAGFEQKTIANKEGFLKKEVDDGKEEFTFEYLEDGKIVKIIANSEDIINQVLA